MSDTTALKFEINFLTEEEMTRGEMISSIEAEFDFVQMCQKMIKPFGFDARKSLDRLLALSLRKLLCDENSLLKSVCPDFKMPPLSGEMFSFPGEQNDMKLFERHPDILIKPQKDWIPLKDWLQEKIAWIDKHAYDIPDTIESRFFHMIEKRMGTDSLKDYYVMGHVRIDGKEAVIWRLKDPYVNREKVFKLLKNKGYYDLTIRKMIKFIADKSAAHLDGKRSTWIDLANRGKNWEQSAISVFATHMIYAATKQIDELKNYLEINPMIEML